MNVVKTRVTDSAAHAVQFYEDPDILRDAVARYVGIGLARGEPVVVIATELHREQLRQALLASSFDVRVAQSTGRLTLLDAAETLRTFMVGNTPDWDLFLENVGAAMENVARGRRAGCVRAYGEMVDLLVRQGLPDAAIRLEEMWKELGKQHGFPLLSAHVMGGFYKEPIDSDDAHLRAIGLLQQRATTLEAEVERRKELENQLRIAMKTLDVERERLTSIANELANANRTKDDFLATVSHELRTPLNAILGWVRMLRGGMLPEEKKERALETIERNANAQTQLIEDLLDVSRIISGKLRLELTSVEVPSVVENAIEAVRPAANARAIALTQTIALDAGRIFGDPDRLQQIVWNLLTNAVKFSAKGGAVSVDVRRRESTVEIAVSDNGLGIAPELVGLIFERFRQVDVSPSRKHGGLGLGLAIVRHLVELHGGHVRVESDGAGKGSTFTVCLPIASTHSSSVEPPALQLVDEAAAVVHHAELAGIRILVVDDELDARELLAEVLASCGAKIWTAKDADEAIELVEKRRPDVVVSDISMPVEDGYALVKKLRALPRDRGGKTPAVALTAYARLEDRTKALVAGFNMHVPKPVHPAELIAVIASLAVLLPKRSVVGGRQ